MILAARTFSRVPSKLRLTLCSRAVSLILVFTRRSFTMKNVQTILAAAVLGVSAMALPAHAADEFKETKMDSIPREARDTLQDKTKNKDDVKVFTRHMSDGEDQYTAIYMDHGKEM